jgi:hypothetical protein
MRREFDEKLLPFAIEESATSAGFTARISRTETASTARFDIFLKRRNDISAENK